MSADALGAEADGFFDMLEERRRSSDLSYAFRSFNPLPYRGATDISASTLNRMVLESQYLSYVIQEIMLESDEPREMLLEEASALLDEMSQNLQLGFIRLLGYAMNKVFKSVFSSIHVNEDGLTRLQQAIQEYPVILLPNHRSYMDFLVLSYIMFTYDLSIPVIAAGIRKYLPILGALMGMKLIGEIFRRSGAFFIRRAIGSDKLYWAVLSEYVRTIVRTGYAPLEFYIEGLRSRTLKSLTPKLGMLHMVLEPFFKGEVFDISLVPISISYERVLEESLLAHELLGVPKPKETTGALLKARTVLKENYGCMHVFFGNPVSVRDLVKGKINHRQYNLVPRDLPMKPSKEMQEFVSGLAHTIIRLQERNVVLSAWNLMAVVLLQNLQGIDLDLLTQKTLWLRRLAQRFGAHLRWPDDIFHNFTFLLELFSNEFVVIPGQAVQDFEEGCSLLQESGVIGRSDEEIYVKDNGQETIIFLRAILQPFIESYQVVFRYLCEESSQTLSEKMFSTNIRSFIMKLLISGEVQSYECLSSDLHKNVLSALLRMDAVTKTKVDDQNEFSVNKPAVKKIWDMLSHGWTPQISVDARL
ncbi:hypothetical protein cypCar_00006280 [Cyprinus carpio]|nr:hypothetical protein cypCar_00006280 [Cyprinus carpio]